MPTCNYARVHIATVHTAVVLIDVLQLQQLALYINYLWSPHAYRH